MRLRPREWSRYRYVRPSISDGPWPAVARARAGQGPSLIEGRTYRYLDHSLGLSRIVRAPYRTEEEVEVWKQRDPITIHQQQLLSHGIATQVEMDQMDAQVLQEIEAAVEFARQSPYP